MAFSVQRKLTAILMADVKGYSRLMGADEEETLHQLRECQDITRRLIEEHRGRLVDAPGDALLADFGSVLDAVRCAAEVQKELGERNAELPSDRRMDLRIGINLGDVIVDGDSLYGDGVNIAARLEALAEAGSVCISGSVYDNVRNKLQLNWDYLGEQSLKNIAQPIRAYRIRSESGYTPPLGPNKGTGGTVLIGEPQAVMGAPLVGRDKETAFLQERINAAVDGQGSLVLVTGPPGIGKSSLVRDLRHYAREKDVLWLEGRYDRARTYPYQTWVEMMRRYLQQGQTSGLRSTVQPYARQLTKLIPELANIVLDTPEGSPDDPETERIRLFEGVTQFFLSISIQRPVVLFIDDLQWATSMDLTRHLARNIGNQRILMIATCRDDEVSENPKLNRAMLAMNRERLFHALPLNALGRPDVEQLVSAHFQGLETTPDLVDLVYERTGGNPFFVEEVMRLLQERKAIIHTDKGWKVRELGSLEMPESIKAVISERLERLGDETENLLRLASVIGREFPLRLLERLAPLEEETLIDILDRCEQAGLTVSEQMHGEELYSFTHDLMQEVLYDTVGPARRRRYHRQVAQDIEKLYANRLEEWYDALALHFLRGNDEEKALEYSVKAGQNAWDSSSWARASDHWETALEILEGMSDATAREAPLLERMSELQAFLGRRNRAYSEKALQKYMELGETRKAASMHSALAAAWTSGTAGDLDFKRAMTHRQAAVKLLELEPDCPEKEFAQSQLANGFCWILDLDQAIQHSRDAVEIAENLKDEAALTRAKLVSAMVLAHSGELDRAEELAESSWEHSLQSKDRWASGRAAVYPILFWPWRNTGSWLDLWLGRVLEHEDIARMERFETATSGLFSLLAASRGMPQEAREALCRAERAAASHPDLQPHRMRFAGVTHAILGNTERAAQFFRRALETNEGAGFPEGIVEACTYYGRLLLGTGDMVTAEVVLKQGYTLAHGKKSEIQELNLLPLLCELYARSERLDDARCFLDQAHSQLKKDQPWGGLLAPVQLAEGVLAAAERDWAKAIEAFAAAQNIEKKHGFPYNEAHVLAELGRMYVKRNDPGDRDRSREQLGQALDIYERCDARRDIEEVKTVLASL